VNALFAAFISVGVPIGVLTGVLIAGLMAAPQARSQSDQPASGEGAVVCLKCHETPGIMEIIETPHANFDDPRSPASTDQCESCHGPSGTHVNFPMQVGNIRFTKHGKTSIAERNAACLKCHTKGAAAHWDEGAHGQKLQCGNCHTIHKLDDTARAQADQATLCGECHTAILSSPPASSSHPLTGERAMICSQCHDPHGPTRLAACVDCHLQDAKSLARQSPKAQDYHARATAEKIDCTACHKGFVHAMPRIN
jgi:predicted CXXCH cytochrome family protein